MRQRSNLIVVLGLAVFVVGAAAAWLVLRDAGTSSASDSVPVLYAAKPLPAGTVGEAALSQGLIKTHKVDVRTKPATALVDSSQVAGRTVQTDIAEGQTLVGEQFQVAQTAAGTVNIPAGKEAVALQLANVPGVAGFAGAGDKIDVLAVTRDKGAQPGAPAGGAVHRIMTGVDILKVNGTTLIPNQGQPGGPGLVYLLAVTPEQAEHLVYLTSFDQLYFALIPKNNPPTQPTPGVDAKSILNPVAG